jgi:2-polyprenyl-6-methoxyphenol hydroxylase-like FAD-dependent oxidoreductase
LVKLLHDGLGPADLRFGVSLESLLQRCDKVEATFSDGSSDVYDLVVGADGLHSRTRSLLFGEQPCFHTGWGGWVWWADLADIPPNTFVEHWGAGRFAGAYPTRDGTGVFAGAPITAGFAQSGPGRRDRVQTTFAGMGPLVDRWLAAMPADDAKMYFWKLSDVRARQWTSGRVLLLGDAAAGFLPTAGIGASMAMESAAVLADELSRTNARFVEQAMSLFVQRRKKRVERIQQASRRLARIMFVKKSLPAFLRNQITRFYSVEQLAGSIAKAFDEPI